ncbi:DUF590 family protein [Pelomyxa schiedti]|nr:DUF590 family protein [Pelomyxa schiedti]
MTSGGENDTGIELEGTAVDSDYDHYAALGDVEGGSLRARPSLCCATKKDLGVSYGSSVELYFRFLLFTLLFNMFQSIIVLSNIIPHFFLDVTAEDWELPDTYKFGDVYNKRKLFYLSSYRSSSFTYWFMSTSFLGFSWFFSGWLYNLFISKYLEQRKHKRDAESEEHLLCDEDIIEDNLGITVFQRSWRFAVSFLVFLGLLSISCGFTFAFAILEKNFMKSTMTLWSWIAVKLNTFERHTTRSTFKSHLLFKWFIFKCTFHAGWYLINIPTSEERVCGLVYMGDQFLSLIFLDLIVGNFLEVVVPLVLPYIRKQCASYEGSQELRKLRPEFDLTEEYLEILYRQFIIFLGIPFFPLIACIAVFATLLEIFVDRLRLIYICKKPPPIAASFKKQLFTYMVVSALVAYVAFPVGTLGILSGYNFGDPQQCTQQFWPWKYLQNSTKLIM